MYLKIVCMISFLCNTWQIGVKKEDVQFRSIFHIIKDSLEDRSSSDVNEVHASIQTEVRYKLIIDPSDDDSLVRLLFKYGVLKRGQTRLYICSDFPGDSHMRVSYTHELASHVKLCMNIFTLL